MYERRTVFGLRIEYTWGNCINKQIQTIKVVHIPGCDDKNQCREEGCLECTK